MKFWRIGIPPYQSPRDVFDADPERGVRYVGTMVSRERAEQVADLAEAYRLASEAAERFRVELHVMLGIDPTPAPKVPAPEETIPRHRIGDGSHRLDDEALLAMVREEIER